jgi:hypothetical protein
MLVISMSISSADVKYVFIRNGIYFQFLYNQDAKMILPNSSVPPSMIIAREAPAKIATRPVTEYHAETAESATPVVRINQRSMLGARIIDR